MQNSLLKINDFCKLVEKLNFDELLKELMALDKTNRLEYAAYMLNLDIWAAVAEHKFLLADQIARDCGIEFDDDQKIVVISCLALGLRYDLASVNQHLNRLGIPGLKLADNIIINNHLRTWKEICLKAHQIINGLRNNCFFLIEPDVRKIIEYFKISTESDIVKLKVRFLAASDLLEQISVVIDLPPISQKDDLVSKIMEFYRHVGVLQTEIDKIPSKYNFYEIADFISTAQIVSGLKIKMIEQKIPLSDLTTAINILRSKLGKIKFISMISYEEVVLLEKAGLI